MSQEKDLEVASIITAYEGATFTVRLECNSGTGYSWALVGMSQDNVVGLLGMELAYSHPNMRGAPVMQLFTFIALKGTAKKETLRFSLLRPWGEVEIARTVEVNVEVQSVDGLGPDSFVEYEQGFAGATVRSPGMNAANPMLAYGYPGCTGTACAAPSPAMPYGYVYPPGASADAYVMPPYGFGYEANAARAPMMKYGYFGCSEAESPPPLAYYGYANCPNPGPPLLKYGYYGCPDTPGPVVKYGYFGCVDTPGPVVKYGYYGCADTPGPVVKYGYYGCADTPGPVVKYGYYGCTESSPPLVKYGYFGCPG